MFLQPRRVFAMILCNVFNCISATEPIPPIWPMQLMAPCNPARHWLLLAVSQKNSANQIKGFKHFINGWLLTTWIKIFRDISHFLIAVRVYTVTGMWTMASSDSVSTLASDETDDSLL